STPTPLTNAIGDPTNQTATITVGDSSVPVSALSVTASASSNPSVAPLAHITVTGTDTTRTIAVDPVGVGYTDITITVSNGTFSASSILHYAASGSGGPQTRYLAGASDASTAVDVGDGYALVGDDENQALRLYDSTRSGPPVASFDYTTSLGLTDIAGGGPREVDIEASARVGDTVYWIGSESNSSEGKARPNRNRVFATRLSGSGAGATLTFVGYYDHLRQDLLSWDHDDLHGLGADHYGLTASAATGVIPEAGGGAGYNIEGLEFAPDGTTAYLGFRAPLSPAAGRTKALVVAVTNFPSLVTGSPGPGPATFGAPIELDLAGRGIREIRRNDVGQYLLIAGPATDTGSEQLYTWDGQPTSPAVPHTADLPALGSATPFEGVMSLPSPLTATSQLRLLADSGDADWYGDGTAAKDLPLADLKKARTDVVALGGPVDTTPPDTAISSGPPRYTAGGVATFTFTAVDDSGPAGLHFECAVDTATFAGCVSPMTVGGFTEGDHTFAVRAIDAAGNVDLSPGQLTWTVDTTAPILALPTVAATATGPAGAVVTYAVSATDATDGATTLACDKPAGAMFPLGTTVVICTATDRAGNTANGSFMITVSYSWSNVLQPVNADGSSIFKIGSTVPVTFALTGASAGVTNAVATFSYAKYSTTVLGSVVEAVSTSAATTGNAFRYSPTARQYVFNWSTRTGLCAGTYKLSINLGDGVDRSFLVSLR
ncbi:PxKF domain-containing protein, partial [Frankia sp. Cr2]|uniref:PxKF domain-containing protein n=1 Tax=Frankia sp. Cr2 TaxID=3073932 RepID=UPI002AD42060